MALTEAEMYVYMGGGVIGPACLMMENESARKTHGDRVIADALLYKGLCDLGGKQIKTPRERPPDNTAEARYQKFRRAQKRTNRWSTA